MQWLRAAVCGALLAVSMPGFADELYEFENPAEQQRFWALTEQLRCLVCQGQSIAESHAPLATDLRDQTYRMVQEGRSDQEIIQYMTARYGDFVLFRPPVQSSTYLLWFGPFAVLLVGLVVMLRVARRRRTEPQAELSTEQRDLARRVLSEEDDPR